MRITYYHSFQKVAEYVVFILSHETYPLSYYHKSKGDLTFLFAGSHYTRDGAIFVVWIAVAQ